MRDALSGQSNDGQARSQQSQGGEDLGEQTTSKAQTQSLPSRVELDFAQRLKNAAPGVVQQEFSLESQVEKKRSGNVGPTRLSQFGYDSFRDRQMLRNNTTVMGAIDASYRLGIGDEVVVTLRGDKNSTVHANIDRDGRLVLPLIRPVSAAGRSFGEVRSEIEALIGETFLKSEAFISVSTVRSIGVYVVGEVERPGLQRLTGLSTVLDALVAANGIRKTGSLRAIKIIHGDGTPVRVDLYNLLFNGRLPEDVTLADGDRVVVPPLGQTIAIAGEVRQPGIFELPPKGSLSVPEALALAGGSMRPDGYRYMKITPNKSGRDQAVELPDRGARAVLANGEILLLLRARNSEIGGYLLEGHVAAPGVRSLAAEQTARQLFSDTSIFKDNPYLPFAVLQTTDPRTLARHYVSVDLARIVNSQSDLAFHQNDKLIVLGMDDIRYLSSADVQAVLNGRKPPSVAIRDQRLQMQLANSRANANIPQSAAADTGLNSQGLGVQSASLNRTDGQKETVIDMGQRVDSTLCEGLKALSAVVSTTRRERFANAIQISSGEESSTIVNVQSCPPIFDQYPDLLPFVLEYAVTLQGELNQPGAYPILTGTPLSSLLSLAGGLGRDADLGQVEVTRFADERERPVGGSWRMNVDGRRGGLEQVALHPGDIIRFNPVFTNRDTGPVLLSGEVKRPGLYNIYRGERLSDVITRAGGLTDEAYPLGTVFTRKVLRDQEKESREVLIRQVENGLQAALASTKTADTSGAQVSVLQGMIARMRTAPLVGRQVVEADPTLLQVRPEQDTVMEPSDEVTIPKRPNHISVMGAVLHPGAQQFNPKLPASTYIDMAGGMDQNADDSRVFVILPNGQARPLSLSSWNFDPVQLPPGSTIFVPIDTRPFDSWGLAKDLADLMSKVAISLASLAVINNN